MACHWLIVVILLYCVAASTALGSEKQEEKLIGWRGETYKPIEESTTTRSAEDDSKRPWIQTLSWKPRAFVYHNFASQAEVQHLIRRGAPLMRRSTVVGSGNKGVVDQYRTSYGAFLRRKSDPIITSIENRLAAWTHLPVENQEDVQILWYGIGAQYKPHMDSLGRVCTVLIYLHSADEGGETTFPEGSVWADPAQATMQGNMSECTKGHVALKPKPGDALLFFTRNPDYGTEDFHSTHWACPVIKGFKWSAVFWIHGKPFRPEELKEEVVETETPDPGFCKDVQPESRCQDWASSGECEKNPDYMVGDYSAMGQCRRTCKACKPCDSKDDPCYVDNRKASGYLNTDLSWMDS